MPGFQFLSFKQLDESIVALLSKVFEKHHNEKTELQEPRKAQVELIGQVIDGLKRMTVVPDKDAENAANTKARRALYDQWREKVQQIKELEDIREKSAEQQELLKKLEADRVKLQTERDAMSRFISKYRNEFSISDEAKAKVLTDEQRALIITGMLLSIKKAIEVEYSGYKNAFLSYIKKNDPSNSILYAGIDAAIGVTAENKLDADDAKRALAAYNQFVGVMEELKKFDKAKLKKVESKVKDPLYFMTVADHVEVERHGDLLLDTAEEKARYKKYVESELAYLNFKSDVNPLINENVQVGLQHVDAVEKQGQLHTVTDQAHAKLPNGKLAKNKTIRDNEDATHYMAGASLPADTDGTSVKWTADEQKTAYANTMKFFAKGGVKSQLEAGHKLKHVVPEPKPQDPNLVKFSKR